MSRLLLILIGLTASASVALGDARKDCFDKSGDPAIRACTQAILGDPKDVVSLVNRAFEYSQKGDYPRAVADYSKAIELEPRRFDARQGRAWAHLKRGDPAQGLPDADLALQIKPGDPQALDARGHIYEALGRREEAIADFRRALAAEPRMTGSKDGLRRLGASP
jgi:tetratricopeptide (TPR) repeat protein